MIYIVGGLWAFAAFGLWLGRAEPWHKLYYGGLTNWQSGYTYCARSERVRINKQYIWRCAETAERPATGTLVVEGDQMRLYHFDLPPDTLDRWGVVHNTETHTIEVRSLDLEVRP